MIRMESTSTCLPTTQMLGGGAPCRAARLHPPPGSCSGCRGWGAPCIVRLRSRAGWTWGTKSHQQVTWLFPEPEVQMRRDLEGITKSLLLAGHFQKMPGEGALCVKPDIAAFHRKPHVPWASSQGQAVPGPCRHLTAPAPGGAGPGGEGAASPRRAAAPGGGRRPLHRPFMAPTLLHRPFSHRPSAQGRYSIAVVLPVRSRQPSGTYPVWEGWVMPRVVPAGVLTRMKSFAQKDMILRHIAAKTP